MLAFKFKWQSISKADILIIPTYQVVHQSTPALGGELSSCVSVIELFRCSGNNQKVHESKAVYDDAGIIIMEQT